MKKVWAVIISLAMVLSIFSGVTALADDGGVTVKGIYAGSTQVTVTYEAGVFSGEFVTSTLFGHALAFEPKLGTRNVSLSANGGSFTLNLTAPLEEGLFVRLSIGNPEYTFVPRFYTVPPAPGPSSVDSDATIKIVAPARINPYLVDANSELANTWFGATRLEDAGLNFGTREYTTKQAAFDSINMMSMIYSYQETYEDNISVFEVTCEVTDFLTEDDTAVFNDFSLKLQRDYAGQTGGLSFSNYISRASVYEDKEELDLTVGEPVVAVRTNGIGNVIFNYAGTLMLEANGIAALGDANAAIMWDIAFAVEP